MAGEMGRNGRSQGNAAVLFRGIRRTIYVVAATAAGPVLSQDTATGVDIAALSAWSPGYAELCLLPGAPDQPADLEAIRDRLAGSDALDGYPAALIFEADPVFCLDPVAVGCRGYYEPSSNIIALAPDLDFDERLVIAVHELRHLDQAAHGFVPSLAYSRRASVRTTFALEADAQAIATLYAWTERAAGRPDAWEATLGLEHFEDIAPAFAAAFDQGGDLAFATRVAFAQWYASDWRRETYYASACSSFLDQIDASKAIRSYIPLPAGHFDELCRLPDGSNYGCHLTDEIADFPRR